MTRFLRLEAEPVGNFFEHGEKVIPQKYFLFRRFINHFSMTNLCRW